MPIEISIPELQNAVDNQDMKLLVRMFQKSKLPLPIKVGVLGYLSRLTEPQKADMFNLLGKLADVLRDNPNISLPDLLKALNFENVLPAELLEKLSHDHSPN